VPVSEVEFSQRFTINKKRLFFKHAKLVKWVVRTIRYPAYVNVIKRSETLLRWHTRLIRRLIGLGIRLYNQ
jgi:hypothetical protein